MTKGYKPFFSYRSSTCTHLVRGSRGRLVSLGCESDLFTYLPPSKQVKPSGLVQSHYAVSLEQGLDSTLERLSKKSLDLKVKKPVKIQSGWQWADHLRNAMQYKEKRARAQEFLEKLKTRFELIDMLYIAVPRSGYYFVDDGITARFYKGLGGNLETILKRESQKKRSKVANAGGEYLTGLLTLEQFEKSPFLQGIVKTEGNIKAVIDYVTQYHLRPLILVPDINTISEIEVQPVQVGGDEHHFIVYAGGEQRPTLKTYVRWAEVELHTKDVLKRDETKKHFDFTYEQLQIAMRSFEYIKKKYGFSRSEMRYIPMVLRGIRKGINKFFP